MPKISEVKKCTTQTVVVYGAPKSGKTELVAKLSKEFNILWFDLEHGYETIFKLPKEQQERIHLVSLPDTKIYPIAVETMQKVIKTTPTLICNDHGKVDCATCKKIPTALTERIALSELNGTWIVVVDSITQLANSTMNHLTKHQDDLYKFEWDDYRAQGGLMDKFLSQVQQARYNIVCITHEAEVEMEDGRKKLVPVAGTTNFSRNTAKYFGHAVYCVVKNKSHTFGSATTFSNNILTGSRTDFDIEEEKESSLLNIFRAEKNKSVVYPTQTLEELAKIAAEAKAATTITKDNVTNVAKAAAAILKPNTVVVNNVATKDIQESTKVDNTPAIEQVTSPQEKTLPAPGTSALAALAKFKNRRT